MWQRLATMAHQRRNRAGTARERARARLRVSLHPGLGTSRHPVPDSGDASGRRAVRVRRLPGSPGALAFLGLFFLRASSAVAYSGDLVVLGDSPPDERTGAPGELTCNLPTCHDSFTLCDTADPDPPVGCIGGITIGVDPDPYEPGALHTVTVQISHMGQLRWGFELTALDGDQNTSVSVGDLLPGAGMKDSVTNQREYVKHKTDGASTENDGHVFTFWWRAPQSSDPVWFYAAGNAANGNFNELFDYIYIGATTVVPEPGATPATLAALGAVGLLARRRRLRDRAGPRLGQRFGRVPGSPLDPPWGQRRDQ